MGFINLGGPRFLMEIIDVLSNDGFNKSSLFHVCDRQVCRVGLGFDDATDERSYPFKKTLRVVSKSGQGSHFQGFVI